MHQQHQISRNHTFKPSIPRDFKHKKMTPAQHAPKLLTNQRSILTEGQI